VAAIGRGALRTSPAIADRLTHAEEELGRLRAAARPQKVMTELVRRLQRVMDRYRAIVERIDTSLSEGDLEEARATLRELFGSIRVIGEEREVRFEADPRETRTALLRAAGGSVNNPVAGAGFGTYLQDSLGGRLDHLCRAVMSGGIGARSAPCIM
jgi:hypothetical protein